MESASDLVAARQALGKFPVAIAAASKAEADPVAVAAVAAGTMQSSQAWRAAVPRSLGSGQEASPFAHHASWPSAILKLLQG